MRPSVSAERASGFFVFSRPLHPTEVSRVSSMGLLPCADLIFALQRLLWWGMLCAGLLLASVAGHAQPGFGASGPQARFVTASESARPGETFRVAFHFSLTEGWHVNSHTPLEEFLIPTALSLEPTPGITVKGIAYPEHQMYRFSFSPEPMAVYGEYFTIGAVLRVALDATPGPYEIGGALRYQACNDRLCMPPRDLPVSLTITVSPEAPPAPAPLPDWFEQTRWADAVSPDARPAMEETAAPAGDAGGDWLTRAARFEETGRLAGFANTAGFLAFLDAAEQGTGRASATPRRGWVWMLPAVLGGGLLLNLTPCVLPLIPINIAIIGAGARAGSRRRGFALGGAYGLGIALVYGMLGLVVVLGMSAAFGALNATAWFNAAIALLFVALGLAMFDVIAIDFSRYQGKFGLRGGGGFAAALGMGAVSALLAGACVAPVVIYTILQAQDLYSQGHAAAPALPFVLGVGMALPWPFLGAGLSLLPAPGKWMTRVKQGFGVFILGFAFYYGHLAYTLTGGAVTPASEEDARGWTPSLEAGLARALEEGRPVIIDFWATWCKNCIVMDRTVLSDAAVQERLKEYVKIKYQAERLSESPVKEVVEHYQVLGLPTFIVLRPRPGAG